MNNSTIFSWSKDDNNSDEAYWELQWVVLLGILLTFIIATGITGNTLTLVAFIRDKTLQNVYNTYLFNLALTDLVTSAFIMPLMAVYTLQNFSWAKGNAFCIPQMAVISFLGVESIIMMLLISADRFLLFQYGAKYILKETKKRAVKKILVSWILSLCFTTLMIIRWSFMERDMEHCDVMIHDELTIAVVVLTISLLFISPFIILGCMHVHIYREIRRRSHIWPCGRNFNSSARQTNEVKENCEIQQQAMTIQCSHTDTKSPPNLTKSDSKRNILRNIFQRTASTSLEESDSSKVDTKLDECIMTRASRRRHMRAAQYLSSLILVFGICWAPYMITNLLATICEDCISHSLHTVMYWFVLLKCSINPHLYATNNKKFRQNFQQILRVKFSK